MPSRILTVNGGSSTIKFAVFCVNGIPSRIIAGQVEGIGKGTPELTAVETSGNEPYRKTFTAADHRQAANSLIDWITEDLAGSTLDAIGHRVVHGGFRLVHHQAITPDLIRELQRTQSLDLTHLPREIGLIEAFRDRFPTTVQVACFDSAFTRALPSLHKSCPFLGATSKAGFDASDFTGSRTRIWSNNCNEWGEQQPMDG